MVARPVHDKCRRRPGRAVAPAQPDRRAAPAASVGFRRRSQRRALDDPGDQPAQPRAVPRRRPPGDRPGRVPARRRSGRWLHGDTHRAPCPAGHHRSGRRARLVPARGHPRRQPARPRVDPGPPRAGAGRGHRRLHRSPGSMEPDHAVHVRPQCSPPEHRRRQLAADPADAANRRQLWARERAGGLVGLGRGADRDTLGERPKWLAERPGRPGRLERAPAT